MHQGDFDFLPAKIDQLEITPGNSGPVTIIEGNEINIIKAHLFRVFLYQNAHAKSKEDYDKIGKFFHADLGDEPDSYDNEFIMFPIKETGRAMRFFKKPYDMNDKNKLLCYSSNTLNPSDLSKNKFSEVCGVYDDFERFIPVCKHAKWGEDNQPPDCHDLLYLAVFDMKRKIPCILQLKKTGLQAWHEFKRNSIQAVAVARVKGYSPYELVCKVTSEQIDGRQGLKYKFRFLKLENYDPRPYFPIMKHYAEKIISKMPSDIVAGERDDGKTIVTETGNF